MKLKIIIFILGFLIVVPLISAPANYGAGAYGAGVYGQASCGDAVCEAGETCSSCSSDCGVCAPDQVYGVILEYKFTEKINSWATILPGGTVLIDDFEEDYGINSIRIVVGEESKQAKITVRKYHAKPEDVFVEAPGIVYKYLQIETENFENLTKATVSIKVMGSWTSENDVDIENVSLYRFDESLSEWIKLDTNFVNGNGTHYFYDTILNSFSFFAISGETLTPTQSILGQGLISEETEKKVIFGEFNLLWIIAIILTLSSICLLIVIIIISKENKDLEFLKSKQRYDYLSR